MPTWSPWCCRRADGQRLMVEVAAGDQRRGCSPASPTRSSTRWPALASPAAARCWSGTSPPTRDCHVHLSERSPIGAGDGVAAGRRAAAARRAVVGRMQGRHRFDEAELDMATTFANHAGAGAWNWPTRAPTSSGWCCWRTADRIARDLHDHVIQRLFAAGLTVQSVAAGLRGQDPAGAAGAWWCPGSTRRFARSAPRSSSCAASSVRRPARYAPGCSRWSPRWRVLLGFEPLACASTARSTPSFRRRSSTIWSR